MQSQGKNDNAWNQIYKKRFIRVYWWYSILFLCYSHISPLACIIKHLHIFVLKTREVQGNFCDPKIRV